MDKEKVRAQLGEAAAKSKAAMSEIKANFKADEGATGVRKITSMFVNLWKSGTYGKVALIASSVVVLLLLVSVFGGGESLESAALNHMKALQAGKIGESYMDANCTANFKSNMRALVDTSENKQKEYNEKMKKKYDGVNFKVKSAIVHIRYGDESGNRKRDECKRNLQMIGAAIAQCLSEKKTVTSISDVVGPDKVIRFELKCPCGGEYGICRDEEGELIGSCSITGHSLSPSKSDAETMVVLENVNGKWKVKDDEETLKKEMLKAQNRLGSM